MSQHYNKPRSLRSSEKQRIWEIRTNRAKKKEARVASVATPKLNVNAKPAPQPTVQDLDVSSDDEDNHLFIDTGMFQLSCTLRYLIFSFIILHAHSYIIPLVSVLLDLLTDITIFYSKI